MDQTLTLIDIAIRLVAAAVLGGIIGLDRNLHAKSTGIRTHGLVAVGSAFVVVIGASVDGAIDQDSVARIAQGILAGIGFLGAGVILRNTDGGKVHGLTTAASIWATAAVGVGCAVGQIGATALATATMLTVVLLGGKTERALRRFLARHGLDEKPLPEDTPAPPLSETPERYDAIRRNPTD
jgi:putative Mg2+ transporter-C (MgtC) family protein